MHYVFRLLFFVVWLSSLPAFAWSQGPNSLDEITLNKLTINPARSEVDLQPGQAFQFRLIAFEFCYSFQPVTARVVWSVEPAKAAWIDANLGGLVVEKATPHDTVFTVKANVEDGRRVLSTKVRVFTREGNPLAGMWRQEGTETARSNQVSRPFEYIEALLFRADGTFSVTWMPFECYTDYWGIYSFNKETGRLNLGVQGGNYVPHNVDGDGEVVFHGSDRLTLKGICLGSYRDGPKGPNCDLSFKRPY